MSQPLIIPTFFGGVELGVPTSMNTGMNVLASRQTSYINGTTTHITVVQRSGLRLTIPPSRSFRNGNFIIRTNWNIKPEVKENVRRVLDEVDSTSSMELQLLKRVFDETSKQFGYYAQVDLLLDYPISVEQIRQHGKSVYHHESDTVISLLGSDIPVLHPYSEAGRNLKMMMDTPVKVGGTSFGYCVEIVDNTGKFGDRFLNVANQVYRVRPVTDPKRRDGIYIGASVPDSGTFMSGEYEVQSYALDDPDHEKRGIFRTHEEAKHLGDLSNARKLELVNLEHTTAQLKRDNEIQKQRHAREIAEMEMRVKTAEAAQRESDLRRARREAELEEERKRAEHLLAMEKMRVKDKYDERSMERKDRSEALKLLPTIIVGIGAAIPIILKLLKPG